MEHGVGHEQAKYFSYNHQERLTARHQALEHP
jgi:hypothetical protein